MKKLAVITGATKGIGKALAEVFAEDGFDIYACARSQDDLKKVSAELSEKYPSQEFNFIKADLSKREEVSKFAEAVLASGRDIDVLINNTGIYTPGQVHNEDEGVLENLVQTNLYSAYHLTRALIKNMIEVKKGHIFNICSTASIMPYVNGGSYCITKYALYGMSKVLREEMKPHGIKVTSVLPGATYTASWEGVEIPESRFMKSEDVAKMVYSTYTLSENSVVEDILIRPQLGDL
ncbi:SDR family oxidoreductase [Cytophagaceae bacterium ABcell3]|nr:SDR family oxidoreductase [Cytophagaceae bacterium ABcell3]